MSFRLSVVTLSLIVSVVSLAKGQLVVGNNRISLSSGLGQHIVRDTAVFLCYDCLLALVSDPKTDHLYEMTYNLTRNNPRLVKMYYQQLLAASTNQPLADQDFANFAQWATSKLYRLLQKIDPSSSADRESLVEWIDYKVRRAYDKNRILGFVQGQRVSEILEQVADKHTMKVEVVGDRRAGDRSRTVDLIGVNSQFFRNYVTFESQLPFESRLPDEDVAQVLAVAEGRDLDNTLLGDLLGKIGERKEIIAELGIVLHNVLNAHQVDPLRFEKIIKSLFLGKGDPIVVIIADLHEMDRLGIPGGQQGKLNEYLHHLHGKNVMIIKRLNDQLQIEVAAISDAGAITTISKNSVDSNTIFKDKSITLNEVFNLQQENVFNPARDFPFPMTWEGLIDSYPSHYYLLAKLTLAMGWGENDIKSFPDFETENLIKLIAAERDRHLDDPAKLGAIDFFVDNFLEAYSWRTTISLIDQTMEDHQLTISDLSSPYLDDLSPLEILTFVKSLMKALDFIHSTELTLKFILNSDNWYQQGNLVQLVKLLREHQLVEDLTSMPSYRKLISQPRFSYRDYLQLQIDLEDLLHKLPKSSELYLAVIMLPLAVKLENLANDVATTNDVVASLRQLPDPVFQEITDKLASGDIKLEQLQTSLQKIIDLKKQRQLPPPLVNDTPTEISYVPPHWLQETRVYREQPGVIALRKISDTMPLYERIETISEILGLTIANLIIKMNKHRNQAGPRQSSFSELTIRELLNRPELNRKDFQTINRYMQAIEEIYQRQLPNLIKSNTKAERSKGVEQYSKEITNQLQLIRKELRSKVS